MTKVLKGLFVAIAVTSMCACSSDDVLQSSQVNESSEVRFSFFDASMEEFGANTRADDTKTKSWKETFKRLDIALFSVDKIKKDTVIHQLSTNENYGNLSVRLPIGKYHLVGVVSTYDDKNKVEISSAEKVTFPNNNVTDMAYVYKDLDVKSGTMTANCLLSRAITKFTIKSTDVFPADVVKVEVTYVGNICTSFNPATGLGIGSDTENTITRSYDVSNRVGKQAVISLYAFLPQESETIKVDLKTYDKEGNVLKALHFDGVKLQLKHITTYTGPLFTSGSNFDFSFDNTELIKSDNDKEFGDDGK